MLTYSAKLMLYHHDYIRAFSTSKVSLHMKTILFCLIFIIQLVFSAGTTALQFLKINTSAKVMGIGETFTAIGDDVNSIHYNPAGLSFMKEKQLTLSHLEYIQGIRYSNIAYAQRTRYGTFGGSLGYLHAGDIRETIRIGPEDYEIIGKFHISNLLLALSYSRFIDSDIFLGLNLKYANETLKDYRAYSFMFDVGLIHYIDKIFLGIAFQNIGTQVKFIKKQDPPPMLLRAGIGYKNKSFLLGSDFVQAIDSEPELRMGLETKAFNFLFIRLGYRLRGFKQHKLGYLSGITAGAGINILNYQIDFAFIPYGDFGNSARVSLTGKY